MATPKNIIKICHENEGPPKTKSKDPKELSLPIVTLIDTYKRPEQQRPLPCGTFCRFEEFRDFILSEFTIVVPGDPSSMGVGKTGYKLYDRTCFAVYIGDNFGRLEPLLGNEWGLMIWSFTPEEEVDTSGPSWEGMLTSKNPEVRALYEGILQNETSALDGWKKIRGSAKIAWRNSFSLKHFLTNEDAARDAWNVITTPSLRKGKKDWGSVGKSKPFVSK